MNNKEKLYILIKNMLNSGHACTALKIIDDICLGINDEQANEMLGRYKGIAHLYGIKD